MSDLFIWIYSGEGGVTNEKYFKGVGEGLQIWKRLLSEGFRVDSNGFYALLVDAMILITDYII
jgi:hypothetical protein